MVLQYSPYLPLLLLAALCSGVVGLIAWQRRVKNRGPYLAFAALMLACVIWLIGYSFEIAFVELSNKLLAAKIRFVGIVMSPVAWFAFAAYYTGRERWIAGWRLLLLCVIPATTSLLMWANESLHLVWQRYSLVVHDSLTLIGNESGPWFFVHLFYSYVLMMVGLVLFVRAFIPTARVFRLQVALVLVGMFAPTIANVLSIHFRVAVIDLTPYAFTISGLAFGFGLLRLRLLDITPIARDRVFENMSDGVIVLDSDNRILDLNAAAHGMLANHNRDMIGQHIVDYLPKALPLLQDVRSTAEIRHKSALGERWIEVSRSSLQTRTRITSGRILILHDFTDRKRAEQQIRSQNEQLVRTIAELEIARQRAEESTRLKSEFLAMMSHELRTPLNAIIGFTELILEELAGPVPPEQANYQRRVLMNARHLLDMISEILDLSRLESGQIEVRIMPIQLRTWLYTIVDEVRGSAEQKGLQFNIYLDPALPEIIEGEPNRLRQLVLHLLSNAVKFTENGFVELEIGKVDEAHWKIEVSDSGIGIPEHMQEMIFEEFRQVDATSTRAHGGTGLGLAIVRRLAQLMHGDVKLHSQPGAGSTFTVLLPLISAPAPIAELQTEIGDSIAANG